MQIHHVGYLVKNLSKSEKAFFDLGYEVDQETKYDHIRKINIEFLVNGNYCVELIEPAEKDSPIYPLLKKYKNTPYHLCYITEDLEAEISDLEGKGYMVFNQPEVAPCIDNRKVCFLIHPSMGMIELVEA